MDIALRSGRFVAITLPTVIHVPKVVVEQVMVEINQGAVTRPERPFFVRVLQTFFCAKRASAMSD